MNWKEIIGDERFRNFIRINEGLIQIKQVTKEPYKMLDYNTITLTKEEFEEIIKNVERK